MPLAEPSYQANTTGARLAGEESEPEDVDQVYTSPDLRDDNRPVLGEWVPKRGHADAGRGQETDRLGESPPAMRRDRRAGRANLPAHD